ncbi:MAG: hypothetical protein H6812_13640 [Phycisphaeraceae bacterium]|nr:hypothetical protein [Phycisphaerales bacterium]MCB9844281.1 hypothetical protein [Phycisphaeraceae bacterium]
MKTRSTVALSAALITSLSAAFSASGAAQYWLYHHTGIGAGAQTIFDTGETNPTPGTWDGIQCGYYSSPGVCVMSCDNSESRHWGVGSIAALPGFVSVDTTSHRGCCPAPGDTTNTRGRAQFILDDLVVSSPNATEVIKLKFRVRLDLDTTGVVGNGANQAACVVKMQVPSIGSGEITIFDQTFNHMAPASWYVEDTDVVFVSQPITVQTNEVLKVRFLLVLNSSCLDAFNLGASFSNRANGDMSFMEGEPTFIVDEGVTVNSVQANIVDNFWTPPTTNCPGDIANGDGMVDVDDLNAILSAFGTSVGIGDPRDTANDDGFIDVDDLNVVLGNFGAMCG